MAKVQILSSAFDALNPICLSEDMMEIVEDFHYFHPEDGLKACGGYYTQRKLYTLGQGYNGPAGCWDKAYAGCSMSGKVYLLLTNDCPQKKWASSIKRLKGIFGRALHSSSHVTTGCGGHTTYLWISTDEVEII